MRRDEKAAMTGVEMKAFLATNEILASEFARLMGKTSASVIGWISGKARIPVSVAAYVRLFQMLTDEQKRMEVSRSWKRYAGSRDVAPIHTDCSGEWAI